SPPARNATSPRPPALASIGAGRKPCGKAVAALPAPAPLPSPPPPPPPHAEPSAPASAHTATTDENRARIPPPRALPTRVTGRAEEAVRREDPGESVSGSP